MTIYIITVHQLQHYKQKNTKILMWRTTNLHCKKQGNLKNFKPFYEKQHCILYDEVL